MASENILDDTHPQNTQFADCKIQYLLAQNKLMTVQLSSVSTLVTKYKKIIDLLTAAPKAEARKSVELEGRGEGKGKGETEQEEYREPEPQEKCVGNGKQDRGGETEGSGKGKEDVGLSGDDEMSKEIKKLLDESDRIVDNCIEECQEISTNRKLFKDEQATITPAFFAELVFSYQKTIASLKHSIHQRQILLQQLESTPKHSMKRVIQDPNQSSAIIKAIQSYDIYPKISQKCRKQILLLKQKKNQLIKNPKSHKPLPQPLKPKPSTSTSNPSTQFDKTLKKLPNSPTPTSTTNQDKTLCQSDTLSPFEKTILIYKKKKIFNDILECRVIDLKKKIKQKEEYNKILKARLETQVWQHIQNLEHCARNLDDDDPAYLSMLNNSIKANNMDFSVDISRVLGIGAPRNEQPVNLQNVLEEINQVTDRTDRKMEEISRNGE